MITTTAPATIPANAVNEDQAVDMLQGMGIYLDLIHAALYRLRTRPRTLLVQGSTTFRCERLADDVYVIELAPAAPRFRTR